MLTALLDVVAIALLALGLIVTTISLYGVLRMPDTFSQLHAAGMASGLGVIAILMASVATRDAAVITHAVLVTAFLLLTAPISSHAMAWAAHRRRAARATGTEPREGNASPPSQA
jgi:monovalent cation/proton antiporter MnhG/PhaG subunit